MQLFSLMAQVAPANADQLIGEFQRATQGGGRTALVGLGVTFGLQLVAVAIACGIIRGEKRGAGAAFKLWLTYFGTTLAAAVLAVVGSIFSAMTGFALAATIAGAIAAVLALVIFIAAPKKTLHVGIVGAIGFMLCAVIVWIAGELAATQFFNVGHARTAVILARLRTLPQAEQKKFLDEAQKRLLASAPAQPPSDAGIAADRGRPITERHAAIQRFYAELEKRREAIKPGDTAALDAYTRDLAKYEELLKQLQADAAAAAGKK